MTTTALKKDIHKAVDYVNDNAILKAIYTILKKNAKEDEYSLSPAQKRKLNKRLMEHKQGKLKYYMFDQVNRVAHKALGK